MGLIHIRCRFLLVLALATMLTSSATMSAVIRVKWNSSVSGPGNDWAHAYQSISSAITASQAGDEIWIAGDSTHPYKGAISVKNGIALYGGFAGTESLRDQRDWRANVTIIDGNKDNYNAVVTIQTGAASTTVVDGFTIRNAGSSKDGVYCYSASPTIANNTISRNGNYGVYLNQAKLSLSNNTIAENGVGGVYCSKYSPLISNNIIFGNANYGINCDYATTPSIVNNLISSNGRYGIYCYNAAASIINNTILASSNYGIYSSSSSPTVINNIVAFNANGIYNYLSGVPVLKNNCVYNPGGADYSGLSAGLGDISLDPKLVSLQYGRMHLRSDSPCLDAGLDSAIQLNWTDVDGQVRIQGLHVDIGADEIDGTVWPDGPTIVRVSPVGVDDVAHNGSTWALAKKTLQAGIDAASATGGEVWVASGRYAEHVTLRCYTYVYGGFVGTESAKSERNYRFNKCILDGTSSGTVVTGNMGYLVSAIDGFTIKNAGTSTGSDGIVCASGSSPFIANNIISGNFNNGITCSASSPVIAGNTISGNGINGIFGQFVSTLPTITNNVISGNVTGVSITASASASVVNNTIIGNGTGISSESSPTVINNIIAYNSKGISGSSVSSNNCLYNPGGSNGSGIYGTSIILADPKLESPAFGRAHIQPDSPCIDTGLDSAVITGLSDMDGQARTQGGHVDIGADESDGTIWNSNIAVRVCPGGVDDAAHDGSSWALAKKTVQAGIVEASSNGGEVWVAAGTYVENIELPPYVFLYGGFSGTELNRDERNWTANRTVLDGNGTGNVVTAISGLNANTVDGFTIRNSGTWGTCAGIFCSASMTIAHNTISTNRLYGIYCSAFSGSIANNTIVGNGKYAIYCSLSSPSITNNTISGNSSALCCDTSSPTITNNVIAYNGNGVIKTGTCAPVLKNNCLYNPGAVNYTGLSAGTGDISADPIFVSAKYGQFHLQPNSPCMDTGLDSAVLPGSLDMDAQARIQGSHVDMGSDESNGMIWSDQPSVIRVSNSGSDDSVHDGSSWELAKRTVQAAIDAGSGGEVWIASGTYYAPFVMRPNVYLYGGFAGSESTRDERDWAINKCILDGRGVSDIITVGSGYRVNGIDGFEIRNGLTGILCEYYSCPVVMNNSLTDLTSGITARQYSSPILMNNEMPTCYQAIYCTDYSSPSIVDNTITGGRLGIICAYTSSPTIMNNTIFGNNYGIMCSYTSAPLVQNNIAAFNGIGIIISGGTANPVLKSNCFYNPGGSNYSGLSAGSTDMQIDPKFVSARYGKFHILSDSPCVDAGLDTGVDARWNDMDNQLRIQGAHVDIGADESDGIASTYRSAIIRVSQTGVDDPDHNGSTWALAKRTVQAGVDAAAITGGEVWVASGVYSEHVLLPPYVYMYGGFSGTESERDTRNWATNRSILDGGGIGNVIKATGGYRLSRVDGFTIRNSDYGIYCDTTSLNIENNTVCANSEGGIYCTSSSPSIANNVISANGIYGVYGITSTPTVANNTILGNCTGISCSSPLSAINNIVAYNAVGIVGSTFDPPTLKNNCFYNPEGVNYSGLSAGSTDIIVDPRLASVKFGRLHLQPDSPCIDKGLDTAVELGWKDLDAQSRLQGAHVDIGADESDGSICSDQPAIVRVSQSGSDDASHDGSSWLLAKRTLQAGVDAASAGGEVWVAAGTYNEKVTMPACTYLYGGFAGTESARSERDSAQNQSIILGSAEGNVITVRGGYHLNGIDGLVVKNGNYGIYCASSSPYISNNQLLQNSSGIYLKSSSASIVKNLISGHGYGVYVSNPASVSFPPTISNNIITKNGFGILSYSSALTITNNVLANNATAVSLNSSSATIANNIVAFNTRGVYKTGGSPVLKNNCVYNFPGINYFGLSAGVGDISIDPVFVDRTAGDYHLRVSSPCIEKGLNTYVSAGSVDIDGEPRILGANVDIGADEFTYSIADARNFASDGCSVYLNCRYPYVTTAKFGGNQAFYIERLNRTGGLRCAGANLLDVGQSGVLQGIMGTTPDGERVLNQATLVAGTLVTAAVPEPLFSNCRDIGGATVGSAGISNIGLLVRIAGRVTFIDPTGEYITVSDGSISQDSEGHSGLRVYSPGFVPAGVNVDDFVVVTGISSCFKEGNKFYRRVLARTSDDIKRQN